jgi:predicted aspartyl protease
VKFPFDKTKGLIIVPVEVLGPAGSVIVRLALDTGATSTLLNAAPLVVVGYDPSSGSERTEITTGSGVEYVPRVSLQRLTALGVERVAFPVLSHTLPPRAGVDGLLGLDFFREQLLHLDSQKGFISFGDER